MTKSEALTEFRYAWNEVVTCYPNLKSDTVWKRQEWNNFTDSLCKCGMITEKQYETWSNPF